MSNHVRKYLFVIIAALSTYCYAQQSPQTPRKTMTAIEIGSHVERVLKEAKCLKMTGFVESGSDRITFETIMAHDRLRTNVLQNDKMIMAFACLDGRMQEYRPERAKRPILEYDAPFKYGTDDTVFKTDLDCLVGTLHIGWVGPESDRGSRFHEIIASGEQLADEIVDNHTCAVFRQEWSYVDEATKRSDTSSHTLYVDKNLFVVRRWDTINSGIHRVRAYQTIAIDECPDDQSQWRIEVAADVGAQND